MPREAAYRAEWEAYERALRAYSAQETPALEKRARMHAEAVARHEQLMKAQAERERLFKEFAYREQLRGDVPRAELEARFRKLQPEWGKALPPPPQDLGPQWTTYHPPSDYRPANPDLGPPPRLPLMPRGRPLRGSGGADLHG